MQNLPQSNVKVILRCYIAMIPVAVTSGFIASNAPVVVGVLLQRFHWSELQ